MSFDFPGDTSFSEDRSSSIEINQSFRLAGNLVDKFEHSVQSHV